jgi:hypothetical protein
MPATNLVAQWGKLDHEREHVLTVHGPFQRVTLAAQINVAAVGHHVASRQGGQGDLRMKLSKARQSLAQSLNRDARCAELGDQAKGNNVAEGVAALQAMSPWAQYRRNDELLSTKVVEHRLRNACQRCCSRG